MGKAKKYCYINFFGRTKPFELCEAYDALEAWKLHCWEVKRPKVSFVGAYHFPFADIEDLPMILYLR
jgi:hypothetical protein